VGPQLPSIKNKPVVNDSTAIETGGSIHRGSDRAHLSTCARGTGKGAGRKRQLRRSDTSIFPVGNYRLPLLP